MNKEPEDDHCTDRQDVTLKSVTREKRAKEEEKSRTKRYKSKVLKREPN